MKPEELHDFQKDMKSFKESEVQYSPEQIQMFKEENKSAGKSDVESNDGTAYIPIIGALLEKKDILLEMFGVSHSGYSEIRSAIKVAEEDEKISRIAFVLNTPGGYVSGLDLTAQMIQETKKPTTGIITSLCCSAGYYLASQMDSISALTKGAMVGSIGVATSVNISEDKDMKSMTNTESPNKRPDASTEEGISVIQKELDLLYSVFEDRVMEGRTGKENFSLDNLHSLKGETTIASKAMEIGLIDSVGGIDKTDTSENDSINKETKVASLKPKGEKMDFEKLIAETEGMDEFLAERNTKLLADANAEITLAVVGEERKRVSELLVLMKTEMSSELASAIDEGKTKEEFALSVLQKHSELPTDNSSVIPPVAESEIEETDEEEVQNNRLNSTLDSYFKKD